MTTICTSSDFIDGHAVEARIRELEDELSEFESTAVEAGWTFTKSATDEWVAIGPKWADGSAGTVYTDESRDVVVLSAAEEAGATLTHLADVEELDDLRELRDEAQGYGGWPQCTLINEDKWVDYAQQTADDLGGVTDNWPHRHIDWDAAADELRLDYTEVRFGGNSFLVRT